LTNKEGKTLARFQYAGGILELTHKECMERLTLLEELKNRIQGEVGERWNNSYKETLRVLDEWPLSNKSKMK
jgi:hypothetical protein